MPVFLIILPILIVIALNVLPRRAANSAAVWVALLFSVLEGALVFVPMKNFWLLPTKIPFIQTTFTFATDNLTLVTILAIAITSVTTLCALQSVTQSKEKRFNLICLILLAIAGLNGVVLASDVFTLYIFLEIVSAASFIMIASNMERDGYEGAFKYLLLSAVATALILASVGLILLFSTSLSYADIAKAVSGNHGYVVLLTLMVLLGAFFIKAGQVPFHGWLPDAYESAPDPISIFLAGIVTKTVGLYTMMRIFVSVTGLTVEIQTAMMVVGVVSIVVGAVAAIGQKDMKRMLAYSSISQMGYIIAGVSTGSVLGLVGAMLHFFNHTTFKSLLFMNAQAVNEATGTRDMRMMGGISERMPVTGFGSTVAFLSTAGIPPLSGFWSKLFIVLGVWFSGFQVVAGVMIIASIITLAYFLLMQRKVFFGKIRDELSNIREAGAWIVVPTVLLTLTIIIVGLAMPWLFETFLVPMRSIL